MGASPVEPTVAQPPHPHPEVVIPVTRSDAKAAGGADLIHRTLSAVVSPDAPDVRAVADEVVAALKNMGPAAPSRAASLVYSSLRRWRLSTAIGSQD